MGDETTPESTAADDVDQQFRALLEGLRTTLPGTETLVGFLLILPLQAAFADFDGLSRWTYYVAFFAAAVAAVLLIAPSTHQRVRGPMTGISRSSRRHLQITVWVTIAGTLSLAIAIAAAVFLVSRLVFTSMTAAIASAAVVFLVAWSWFFLPLVTFRRVGD